MRQERISLATVLCFLLFSGCSSAPTAPEGRNEFRVKSLILESLSFRRPPGRAADPQAWWDEPEYRGNPVPNAKFDCEPAQNALRQFDYAELRRCWSSIPRSSVIYRLDRSAPVPSFVLRVEKGTPACLETLLKEIPVPREIVFQAPVLDGPPECFASGVHWDSKSDVEMSLSFPLESMPETDSETWALLVSWALAPFWDAERQGVPARYLPESLCRVCIDSSRRFRGIYPGLTLWPGSDASGASVRGGFSIAPDNAVPTGESGDDGGDGDDDDEGDFEN